MCLYIITQQTGAALHRAQDVEGAKERLRSLFNVSIHGQAHAHAANGTLRTQFVCFFFFFLFKKQSHSLPRFSKANS